MAKKELKLWFWEKVGAYCRKCGYDYCDRALHFHHLTPSTKEKHNDTLAVWFNYSKKHLVEKCLGNPFTVLCANCHAELHDGCWHIPDDYKGILVLRQEDTKTSKEQKILKKILKVASCKK